eukprot:137380-Prymnesium_polylepis.1
MVLVLGTRAVHTDGRGQVQSAGGGANPRSHADACVGPFETRGRGIVRRNRSSRESEEVTCITP